MICCESMNVEIELAPLISALQDFETTDLWFSLQAQSGGELPAFWGSMLRGAFGNAFKANLCQRQGSICENCEHPQTCIYSSVFETPLPEQSTWMTRYASVPHPFVFLPPLPGQTFTIEKGHTLQFGMRLVGPAIEWVPYFILAWQLAAQTGLGTQNLPFVLIQVENKQGQILYQPGQIIKPISRHTVLTSNSRQRNGPINLYLETPLRLKAKGQILKNSLPFDRLVSNLLRRLSSLLYFHNDQQIDIDYAGIVSAARPIQTLSHRLYWQDAPRWSNRQQQKMNLGGLLGQIQYAPEAAAFGPLLQAGAILLVGKGTSFGLGRYQLST